MTNPSRPSRDRTGGFGRAMYFARWIVAPIYLGLLVALGLIVVKFVQKLAQTIPGILTLEIDEAIVLVLKLVDLALVGNLLLIVVFAGWENFLAPMKGNAAGELSGWAEKVDFTATKLKLVSSVAAIACVQALETFLDIGAVSGQVVMWQLALLLGFGVAGVLLALMDRISGEK